MPNTPKARFRLLRVALARFAGAFATIVALGCGGQKGPPVVAPANDVSLESIASTTCEDAVCVVPQTGSLYSDNDPRRYELSPDATRIYVAQYPEGSIAEWDAESGVMTEIFRVGNRGDTPEVFLSADGTTLFGRMSVAVRVWDTRTKKLVGSWRRPDNAREMYVSPDGLRVVLGDSHQDFTKEVTIADARTGAVVKRLQSGGPDDAGIAKVLFTKDPNTVLVEFNSTTEMKWRSFDMSTGRLRCSISTNSQAGLYAKDADHAVHVVGGQATSWDFHACRETPLGALTTIRDVVGTRTLGNAWELRAALPPGKDPEADWITEIAKDQAWATWGMRLSGDGSRALVTSTGLGKNAIEVWDRATKQPILRLGGEGKKSLWSGIHRGFVADHAFAVDDARYIDFREGMVVEGEAPAPIDPPWKLVSYLGEPVRGPKRDLHDPVLVGAKLLRGREERPLPDAGTSQFATVDRCGNRVYLHDTVRGIMKIWSLRGELRVEREIRDARAYVNAPTGFRLYPSCDGKVGILAEHGDREDVSLSRVDLLSGAVTPIRHDGKVQLIAISASADWGLAIPYEGDPQAQTGRDIAVVNLRTGAISAHVPAGWYSDNSGHRSTLPGAQLELIGETIIWGGATGFVMFRPDNGAVTLEVPIRGGAFSATGVDARPPVEISPGGTLAAVRGGDGVMSFIRLADGHVLHAALTAEEWVLYTREGYFEASHGGAALLGLRVENRGFRIDQLAIKYNRPDKVLEALGLGAPGAADFFRARRERRLESLGVADGDLDAALARAPKVQIASMKVADRRATLAFDLSSRGREIAQYTVYANGVPLVTKSGHWGTGAAHRVEESVEVASGENTLQVSAIDALGIESLRAMRSYHAETAKRPATLYLLAIGVSSYADARLTLGFAAKDATDLAALIARTGDDSVRIVTRVLANADAATIRAAASFFTPATVDDTAVVFVAGHGGHANDSRYYYLARDTQIATLPTSGVPFQDIEGLLSANKARRRVLLLDTCESGASDADSAGPVVTLARGKSRAVRGLVLDTRSSASPLSNVARHLLQERTRYSLADLGRRSGAVVLSSARGDEASFEFEDLRNGVFTAALLKTLSEKPAASTGTTPLSIHALRQSAYAFVVERTEGHQHPTIDRDNPLAMIELRRADGQRATP